MDDVIKLISQEYIKNKYGVPEPNPTYKEIFCQINSISRQEFFDAGRNGLNPAFEVTILAAEYNGESVLEYNGKTYSIYRTYHVPETDYMELYVERKGGTNGQQESQP